MLYLIENILKNVRYLIGTHQSQYLSCMHALGLYFSRMVCCKIRDDDIERNGNGNGLVPFVYKTRASKISTLRDVHSSASDGSSPRRCVSSSGSLLPLCSCRLSAFSDVFFDPASSNSTPCPWIQTSRAFPTSAEKNNPTFRRRFWTSWRHWLGNCGRRSLWGGIGKHCTGFRLRRRWYHGQWSWRDRCRKKVPPVPWCKHLQEKFLLFSFFFLPLRLRLLSCIFLLGHLFFLCWWWHENFQMKRQGSFNTKQSPALYFSSATPGEMLKEAAVCVCERH